MISALCVLLSATMAFTPTPGDRLTAEMLLAEVAQHGELRKSETPQDPGQCRRFQVNTFAEVSTEYMLASFPEAMLYLPDEHASFAVSGRPVGSCWDMPDASTGNAYVEVARYDFSRDLTTRENREAARAFLQNAQAGDLMQLLARYSSGGRGTHTLLITRPYDPRSDVLHWVDSNFANTLVDGVRYGYVRAYQTWPLDEMIQWLTADINNGATLYRLRDDIAHRTATADGDARHLPAKPKGNSIAQQ